MTTAGASTADTPGATTGASTADTPGAAADAPGAGTDTPGAAAAPSASAVWARRVTDGVEPKNVILAFLPLIGVARYGWTGLAWAAFAALFAAVVPTLFIRAGIRRGSLEDRHVGRRKRRLVVIPFIMASVLFSFAVMVLADAPADMTAMVAAMFAALVPIMVITVWWKVSIHTAVAAGAVVCTAVALGPWWLLLLAAVPVIGWSRVVLRDHTPAQTVVGALVGAATAGLTFWTAR